MKFLDTDFYQLSIVLAYIISGIADEESGYECFYRHPKKELNNVCYFKGEQEVQRFINDVKKELKDKTFVNQFIKYIKPKIRTEKQEEYINIVKKFFEKDFEFEFTVFKDDCIVNPLIPVFQFKGPRWIGQIIETPITNIINGRTGLNTQIHLNKATAFQKDIVEGNRKSENWSIYLDMLRKRVIEYRMSTDVPLMDASFRRAAGEKIAVKTAEISMEYCLNGTSNLRALRVSPFIKAHMVGGTMAHSYIMSYETELRAFQVWNEIFPNTSFLVDTFDTIKAVRKIVRNNLKPKNVRIDSGDFFTVCQEVRDILDENGWNDVGIYISGDLTPELLTELTNKKVPFDQAMIGTKLTNLGEIVNINPGFVYKLVEYTRDGKKYYPVKKASGKGNYPGLKEVIVENGKLHIKPGFGFVNPNLIIENMEVINDF